MPASLYVLVNTISNNLAGLLINKLLRALDRDPVRANQVNHQYVWPSGKKQKDALEEIEKHFVTVTTPTLGIASSPVNTPCLKFEEAVNFLTGTLSTTAQNKRSNEARRLLTALAQGGFIGTTIDMNGESWCWVV